MKLILVVEDDNDINNLLYEVLTKNKYNVEQAYSGTEAKRLFGQRDYALVILDLMLPGLTGEELIRIFRKTSNLPIIVLSAKQGANAKIYTLKLGADDYVTKPFDEGELIARVEANLRRANYSKDEKGNILTYKDIELDIQSRTITVNDSPVTLTNREFYILQLLMSNPRKVFTKENIYESIWNDDFIGDDKTVNVHISNLRTKLGKTEYIKTVWGIGFKMNE